jgi:hypothetical protein
MPNDHPYVRLCLLADKHDLRVGLHAGKQLQRTPRGEGFRDLESLTISIGAGAVLRERVFDGIDSAAQRLLYRLRSIPRFAGQ